MIEEVIGEKLFGLGCGDKGGIASNKGEGELTHEATIGSIPLCPPDPTDALDDGQPGSELNARDLNNKDDVMRLAARGVLLIDHLAYPGTSRFGDVIFHQSTRIEVVEGHG